MSTQRLGSDVPEVVGRFAEPRRLHPASVLFGIPIAQLIQVLIVPLFAGFAAGGLFSLVFLAIAGVVGLVVRILDWHFRRFSFDGEVLRVDHGVLSRNRRSLDVARIQQVEIQRTALARLFGLAAIRVETAGSASEPEVDLRVIPEEDAIALRSAVRTIQARMAETGEGQADAAEGPPSHHVLSVPMKHVVISSVTGARLLVLPAVIGGLFQFVGQQIGNLMDRVMDVLIERGLMTGQVEVSGPDWNLVALGTAAVVVLSIVAAILVGIFVDGRFRIERYDEDLHITRGLVSNRESVVPLRRVQLVEINRNWLRRLLGYATVRIRSAGGSAGGDGRVTVPLLAEAEVDRLLGEILPNVPGVPALRSHPPVALRRALFRWLRPALLAVAVVWLAPLVVDALDVTLVQRLRYLVLVLIPVNAVLAVVEYRQLAHGLTELIVASRRGALSITTSVAPVVKVQAVTTRRSPFQRHLDLSTLQAHVAGPSAVVEVLDAGQRDTAELHRSLSAHAASPVPVVPHEGPDRAPTTQAAAGSSVPSES
ncbi:MAG: PH domain-containing protein [Nitriliruptoraceae bacterium]